MEHHRDVRNFAIGLHAMAHPAMVVEFFTVVGDNGDESIFTKDIYSVTITLRHFLTVDSRNSLNLFLDSKLRHY